jgi:signal transduction histidine kinase/CheY-like chemotaxis protein
MKNNDIRSRMLLASLLPVTLVAIVLAVVFLQARFSDLDGAHNQRARSVARQLATASEYGLFSENIAHLQSIATGALREPDVRSVAIVDGRGLVLVRAGQPGYTRLPTLSQQEDVQLDVATRTDLLMQPIVEKQIKLDDLFEVEAAGAAAKPFLLGHVVMEFSRQALIERQHAMVLVGMAITLGGLLLGGILAVRLGRGVLRPILRVSDMIERIGQGDLSVRVPVSPNGLLHELKSGLNQMAQSLEANRDELEQRIASATQALREKKEEAETATLAKSRFLAAASHDLRQPTHALGMFVARLAQLPHDAQTNDLIKSLEASVRATQDLLDGLLDVSRLDAKAVAVQLRPFALADMFEQLRTHLGGTATGKGLRLRIRPTTVALMSDATLLQRILLNLVSNALLYTQHGGVLLACRVAADGKHARIEVWDSGIGIAPEHQQEIFKEFYQVGNAARERSRGLGLGLNIVQRSAQLLGHRLALDSRLGQGTRFSIEVPLAPLDAVVDRRSPERTIGFHDFAGLLVLVVEDDALARKALVSLLESWGCVVGAAPGLSAALQLLANGLAPAVLVSDYRLGEGKNGIEVIGQLRRAAGWSIPACLISGDTDAALMQAASAELTLLHKPVRPAKLRSLLRRLGAKAQTEDADLV